MSPPKNRFAKIFLISLAVLFVLLLVSLFVITKFILPGKIRSYTEEISRDTAFKVEIKDIEVVLPRELKGEAIEIYQRPGFADPVITIGKVIAKPEILSSLINRVIKIRIAVDKPVFSLSRDELDKFTKLIEERQKEKKGRFPIEVAYVEITDGRVQNPFGEPVLVKKMEVELEDADKEEERIVKLSGFISFRDNDIGMRGRIKPFLDEPSGKLEIDAPRLKAGFLPDTDNFPKELAVSSDLSFLIGGMITSQGVINFKPVGGSNGRDYLSGIAQYDVAYDRLGDTAFIHSAVLNMNDLLRVSLAGRIQDVRTERDFNLNGEVNNIKLKNISALLGGVSPVQFSGDVEPVNLKIMGSQEENNVSLDGRIILSGVDIKDEKNRFEVNELQGELDVEKSFHGGVLGGLSAQGSFSSPGIRTEFGELNKVSGKIEFTDAGSEGKAVTLSSLKASFFNGTISGDASFKTLNGEKALEGKLQGREISLEGIPEGYVPVELGGNLQTVRAEFTGSDLKGFSAGLSFSLRDMRVRLDEKETVKLAGAKTTGSFSVRFTPGSENAGEGSRRLNGSRNADSGGASRQGGNRLTVESEGLYLEEVLYGGLVLQRANVSELLFKLGGNNRWAMDLSGTGSQFRMSDSEVSLSQFRAKIHTEKNRRVSVSGRISGTDGKFGQTPFPHLSSDFKYGDGLLRLTGLRTQIGEYGELKTGKVEIRFGGQENGAPYAVAFSRGSFSGFDQKIQSEGIRGKLLFYSGGEKPKLEGNVHIMETDVSEARLKNLSLRVGLIGDKINLGNISGKIFGGDLNGNMLISTVGNSRLISSDFKFTNLSLPYNKVPLSLENLSFNFSGGLGEDSFPQGEGKVSFTGLRSGEDGTFTPLRGQVEIQTADETLLLENGFIRGEGEGEINFSIKVENILNEDRGFYINLPPTSLATTQEILSPVLPGLLRNSEISGKASLELTMSRFLQQDTSWKGRVSIEDATLNAKPSGLPFAVYNVNGGILIKDRSSIGKSLVHYIEKGWKIERESFEDFLSLVKKGDARIGEERLLRIQEIEYGFLRLKGIECVIILDKGKINLKRFRSSLYDGKVFAKGFFDFIEGDKYNLSFLFKDISLNDASNSLSVQDYITGRLNGLLLLTGRAGALSTTDGSFNFWTIKSEKEDRRIGKAFLQKLGVREQFILGSSRKYDRGEIYGYVWDGVITFRELHISNTFLGIRDLLIQVDRKRNSISVAHLLSVIRETARRAGGVKIEFEN